MKVDLSSLGGSEIWIMKPDGSQARKIYEADDKSLFRWITWSPDGERVAYVRDRSVSGHHEVTIESRDLRGASRVTMLPSAKLGGFDSLTAGDQVFVWLPDGRVIYAKGEPRADCPTNLVEARVDTHTGALQGEPRQITDWAGFCIFSPSATADGKQLTLLRQTTEVPVYVAEFDSVTGRLSVPSRLTLTEDVSGPVGWTPDNKTVVFFSGREGNWGLYRQGLGRSTSEALVTDLKGSLPIGVSHDWLFYAPTDPSVPRGTPSALMRVPLSGGIPHEVFSGKLSGVGCGWSLRARCVISELTGDRKEIIFTALDPVKGRGPELARFQDDDAESLFWKLSPDGSRVAIVRDLEGRIRV